MPTVASAVVKISADIGDFDKGLIKAQKQLLKAGDEMNAWGKKLSIGFTAPLLAASAALAKSAAEDAASVSKLERAFGSATPAMEKFVGQMMKVTPATDDQLRQLISSTQAFNLSMGMTPQKAAAMTQSITKLAADLAAYNHVELSVASEAITSAIAGKTKALKGLNVVVTEAEVKSRGLSAIEDHMTVMRGEAARTIGDDANAWARFQQSLDSAADSMGQAVLPTFAKFLNVAGSLAKSLADLDSTTKNFIVTAGIVVASLGPMLMLAGNLTKGWVAMSAAVTALTSQGLTGLAAMLTPGGIILAGLAAVGTLIYLSGENSRRAKADLDSYALALVGLPKKELEAQAARLKGLISQQKAVNARPDPNMKGLSGRELAGYAQSGMAGRRVETGNTIVSQLEGMLSATNTAITTLGKSGADAGVTIVTAFDTMIDRAKLLTVEQTATKMVTQQLVSVVGQLEAAYGKLAGKFDDISLKQREALRGAMGDANDSLFRNLSGTKPLSIDDFKASSMSNFSADHPGQIGITPGQRALNNSWGIIANLKPRAITAEVGDSVATKAMDRNTQALKAGLEQVAVSIGQELASKLVIGIAGTGAGSQAGSRFGGQFGEGVGTFLAKNAKTALSFAASPILGAVIGSVAGGLLGSLFNHKKSVDENTKALDRMNASLTGAPSGFKVDPYTYNATKGLSFAGATFNINAKDPWELMRQLKKLHDDAESRGGEAFVRG